MNGAAKKSTWIGGTAFVAVVLVALAWFLLVSPVLATASDTREQTEQTETHNSELQKKVNELKAEFANLDQYKAELATIATQITPSLDLAPYIIQVDQLAQASDVVVIELTPQTPYLVTLPEAPLAGAGTGGAVSTEAAPSPSPSPSASASPSGDETAAPAPAKVEAPAGMTAVPVTMTVVGPYANTVAFLEAVQNTTRLFLVTGLTGTTQNEQQGNAGRPATEFGDLELKIEGFLYVMPSLATPPDPTAEPTIPVMPPAPDRNPVTPIEGSDLPNGDDD